MITLVVVSFFWFRFQILVNIRLDSFWTEKGKSCVTTQRAVEMAQQQNILFFHCCFVQSFVFFLCLFINHSSKRKMEFDGHDFEYIFDCDVSSSPTCTIYSTSAVAHTPARTLNFVDSRTGLRELNVLGCDFNDVSEATTHDTIMKADANLRLVLVFVCFVFFICLFLLISEGSFGL